MIMVMNAEVLTTGIGLTIAVITLGITIYLTSRGTQKLLDLNALFTSQNK